MSVSIEFETGGRTFYGVLYTGPSPAALQERLPVHVRLQRFGGEYRGSIPTPLGLTVERGARTEMKVGELAYWPQRECLCLFVGSTQIGMGSELRAVSEVDPLGILYGDLSPLHAMDGEIDATLRVRDTGTCTRG